MIFLYGDSHAHINFKGLRLPHRDYHRSSITMFRIGRDNTIINFNNQKFQKGDIICLVYGEVDCRCHIQKQINLGRNEDYIIEELVKKYIETVKNQTTLTPQPIIVIVGVIPPTKQSEYESLHGPITHEFPFVGTDEDRVRFTSKVNTLLKQYSKENGYYYLNPYSYYTRQDGTLKFELSDTVGHLADNTKFLEEFMFAFENHRFNSKKQA